MHPSHREGPRNEREANIEMYEQLSSPRPQFLPPKRPVPRAPYFTGADLVIALMAVMAVVGYVSGVFSK